MYILLLGPMLEEKYGSKRILQVIVVTALVTGLINYLVFWKVALCGASGVCFAFILLSSFTSFKEGELPLTVILVAAIFLGQQVYDGIMIKDNISNMAHIFGGILGGVIGFVLNRRK
jgi:GlpG protein